LELTTKQHSTNQLLGKFQESLAEALAHLSVDKTGLPRQHVTYKRRAFRRNEAHTIVTFTFKLQD
jgi:hypothetical protein